MGAYHAGDHNVVAPIDPSIDLAAEGLADVLDPAAINNNDAIPDEPVLIAIKGDDPLTLDPYGHERDNPFKANETCWPGLTVNINNDDGARLREVVILSRQFD